MPSDPKIENIANLELYWIAKMINKDKEEEFLKRRDELEYLASFINPEAVAKVKETRNNMKVVSEEDFENILSSISGREMPEFANR